MTVFRKVFIFDVGPFNARFISARPPLRHNLADHRRKSRGLGGL